jgi:SAM-dependent methyltransferase
MTLAIGRLLHADDGEPLGTVFAVTRRLALTAFHCVGDDSGVSAPRVRCTWQSGTSTASVVDSDEHNDVALLRFDRSLPRSLDPVPLSDHAADHERFSAPGAASALPELPLVAMSGEIAWLDGRLPRGFRGMQLTCTESAAGLSLHGLSGAPVLVGTPKRAVGVIRWNPPRPGNRYLAAGAIVYAAPADRIMQRWPQAAGGPDPADLIRRLTSRIRQPDPAELASDMRALLVSGGLGLDVYDLDERLSPGGGRMIVADSGQTVIRVVRSFETQTAVAVAEKELAEVVETRIRQTRQRYAAVLTNGAHWRLYQHLDGELQLVDEKTARPSAPRDLLGWLEAIMGVTRSIRPNRHAIEQILGADSPSHKMDVAELTAIYERHRDLSTVLVKRRIWAKLLTTASGASVPYDDALFINHTLLVATAKLVGHAAMGILADSVRAGAGALMSGKHFADTGIGGVIESDFFDWITEVPEGGRFILSLARQVERFDWNNVEHDVLKSLYESVIPTKTRHRLGEYYTPDWLAEKIIADSVANPLEERVLDASCGSGTFLFYAIRAYLAAAEAARKTNAETILGVVRHVIGIDVHPVAVTLARVTYLLAIGKDRLAARPAFSVPVYLGDSMRWGQEFDLKIDTYAGLSIPTRLDPESFVAGPVAVGFPEFSAQLNFPDQVVGDADRFDRLVASLAGLVLSPESERSQAAVAAILQRFGVSESDRPDLEQTFETMCKLHDRGQDHIWGYYVRNVARPAWIAKPANRVDVLVGNPPWLVRRHMTQPQKESFKSMSTRRKLWAGGNLATNQDLAALFIARCIELYLRSGGRFGYVMPLSVLPVGQGDTKGAYAGFRSGSYPALAETVDVAFTQAWNLADVKPSFFPIPPGVVFGRRQEIAQAPAPLTHVDEDWIGHFDTEPASWDEARLRISRIPAENGNRPSAASPYKERFNQGATLVPYFIFNVVTDSHSPLGGETDKVSIRSRRSNNEKMPWKVQRCLSGQVERAFIRQIHTGEAIMPFRCIGPEAKALVPADEDGGLIPRDPVRLEEYPGLARYWRLAEEVYNRHRASETLNLLERLDYQKGLSKQLGVTGDRVVYAGSAMYMAAAVVSGPRVVVEHQGLLGADGKPPRGTLPDGNPEFRDSYDGPTAHATAR